eukprot:jgi/Tetstr1/442210/TSEL_030357.t1
MKRVVENSRYGRYGLRKRASAGSAAINARISGYSGAPTQAPAENRAAGSKPAVESGAAGSDAVGRKATPINSPFVPMLEGAFDMATVERSGQHYGYMSNEGPVKVLEHPRWRLRKDPTWMQAPSVCPGKPTKKGLDSGAPPKKQQEYIQSVLDLMAEGKYTEEVDGVETVFQNRCTFLTRDCAQLNLTYGGPGALKTLNVTGEQWEKLRTTALLDLKPRSLGSCALVANSENMLAGKRGPEIDAHDTIFRHNTPVKGFAKAVGKRPTSVQWVKGKYMKLKGAGEAELMYDLLVGLDRLPKELSHRGKNLLIVNKRGGGNKFIRERSKIYKMAGAGGKNHPSGGFSRPLSVLASGLCTRVDLYGFSSKPSGKYFERSFKVLDTHMMGFEHWVYRYLMSQGKMCVYGE